MDLQKLTLRAAQELAEHNLPGWSFAFGESKRRLGVCKYLVKRIEIARYYATHSAEDHVLDTLFHEIAHALAGPKAGHGPVWQAIAIRLGAKPQACDRSGEAVVQPGDWQADCPGCTQTHHRYKQPPTLTGYRCRCVSRSSLNFAYRGDPARRPPPVDSRPAWSAICDRCKIVHKKMRRPKAGKWLCQCGHPEGLVWKYGTAQ